MADDGGVPDLEAVKAPGNLAGFSGKFSVDVYAVHYWSGQGESHDNYVRVVAGRVASDVRRVTIDWSSGRRTDAVVTGGFFIARTPAKTVRSKDPGDGPHDISTPLPSP
ncbi:hypothetical protein GCM10018965_043040 [Nonomuraea roseola]